MPSAIEPQRPPLVRPKSKSGFSFRSADKIQENHADKRAISGKANPNAAMNEIQPAAAALEKPTLASLRSLSYNDQYGNLITDPDRSNPTRPRWERPLETIKSFEAAIDSEYKTRSRTEVQSDVGFNNNNSGYGSRRSSSYWGGGYDHARPDARSRQHSSGNYYQGRESYGPHRQLRPSAGGIGPRQQSDPTLSRWNQHGNGSAQGSPSHGSPNLHQSRETLPHDSVSAGSGSDRWVSGTDPTNSENSSIDRARIGPPVGEVQHPEYTHFGGPIMEDGPYLQNSANASSTFFSPPAQYNYNYNSPPPPPPKHEPRKLVSLSPPQEPYQSGGAVRPPVQTQPEEKRKSWLRRRFSSKAS